MDSELSDSGDDLDSGTGAFDAAEVMGTPPVRSNMQRARRSNSGIKADMKKKPWKKLDAKGQRGNKSDQQVHKVQRERMIQQERAFKDLDTTMTVLGIEGSLLAQQPSLDPDPLKFGSLSPDPCTPVKMNGSGVALGLPLQEKREGQSSPDTPRLDASQPEDGAESAVVDPGSLPRSISEGMINRHQTSSEEGAAEGQEGATQQPSRHASSPPIVSGRGARRGRRRHPSTDITFLQNERQEWRDTLAGVLEGRLVTEDPVSLLQDTLSQAHELADELEEFTTGMAESWGEREQHLDWLNACIHKARSIVREVSPSDRPGLQTVCAAMWPAIVSFSVSVCTSVGLGLSKLTPNDEELRLAARAARMAVEAAGQICMRLRDKRISLPDMDYEALLGECVENMVASLTSHARSLQVSLLSGEVLATGRQLAAGGTGGGMSAHQISTSVRLLPQLWKMCGDLVRHAGRGWPARRLLMQKELCDCLNDAAFAATEMLQADVSELTETLDDENEPPCAGARFRPQGYGTMGVWGEGLRCVDGPGVSDEEVQAQSWVPALLHSLLTRSQEAHERLRDLLTGDDGQDSLQSELEDDITNMMDSMHSVWFEVVLGNTQRVAGLCAGQEALACWALEVLKGMAEEALRLVQEYDKCCLGLGYIIRGTDDKPKVGRLFATLKRSTDDVVNSYMRLRRLLKLRRADQPLPPPPYSRTRPNRPSIRPPHPNPSKPRPIPQQPSFMQRPLAPRTQPQPPPSSSPVTPAQKAVSPFNSLANQKWPSPPSPAQDCVQCQAPDNKTTSADTLLQPPSHPITSVSGSSRATPVLSLGYTPASSLGFTPTLSVGFNASTPIPVTHSLEAPAVTTQPGSEPNHNRMIKPNVATFTINFKTPATPSHLQPTTHTSHSALPLSAPSQPSLAPGEYPPHGRTTPPSSSTPIHVLAPQPSTPSPSIPTFAVVTFPRASGSVSASNVSTASAASIAPTASTAPPPVALPATGADSIAGSAPRAMATPSSWASILRKHQSTAANTQSKPSVTTTASASSAATTAANIAVVAAAIAADTAAAASAPSDQLPPGQSHCLPAATSEEPQPQPAQNRGGNTVRGGVAATGSMSFLPASLNSQAAVVPTSSSSTGSTPHLPAVATVSLTPATNNTPDKGIPSTPLPLPPPDDFLPQDLFITSNGTAAFPPASNPPSSDPEHLNLCSPFAKQQAEHPKHLHKNSLLFSSLEPAFSRTFSAVLRGKPSHTAAGSEAAQGDENRAEDGMAGGSNQNLTGGDSHRVAGGNVDGKADTHDPAQTPSPAEPQTQTQTQGIQPEASAPAESNKAGTHANPDPMQSTPPSSSQSETEDTSSKTVGVSQDGNTDNGWLVVGTKRDASQRHVPLGGVSASRACSSTFNSVSSINTPGRQQRGSAKNQSTDDSFRTSPYASGLAAPCGKRHPTATDPPPRQTLPQSPQPHDPPWASLPSLPSISTSPPLTVTQPHQQNTTTPPYAPSLAPTASTSTADPTDDTVYGAPSTLALWLRTSPKNITSTSNPTAPTEPTLFLSGSLPLALLPDPNAPARNPPTPAPRTPPFISRSSHRLSTSPPPQRWGAQPGSPTGGLVTPKTQLLVGSQWRVSAEDEFWSIKWNHLAPSLVRKLGSGSYGQVWQGTYHGADVAIKVINIDFDSGLGEETVLRFKREVDLQRRLSHHPNVVRFIGACCEFPQSLLRRMHETVIGDQLKGVKLAIVMELCRMGSLFDVIRQARQVGRLLKEGARPADLKRQLPNGFLFYHDWLTRLEVLRGAAAGVDFMHSHNVVHRDLTSYNLLLDYGKPWQVKVADFNLSRMISNGQQLCNSGNPNSPGWQSPELLKGDAYGREADAFSFGVIIWEVITLKEPWRDEVEGHTVSLYYIMNSVIDGKRLEFPPAQEVMPECPELCEVIGFAKECWCQEPSYRPPLGEVARRLGEVISGMKDRLRRQRAAARSSELGRGPAGSPGVQDVSRRG